MKLLDGILYLDSSDLEKSGIGNREFIEKEQARGARWCVFIRDPNNEKEILIEYRSLSKKYSAKVINYFGNPIDHLVKQTIRSFVVKDEVAEKFYTQRFRENNDHLPEALISANTIAAGWLNMLVEIETDSAKIQNLLNLSLTEFHAHVVEIIEQDKIRLPYGFFALRKLIDAYKSGGYRVLLSPPPSSNGTSYLPDLTSSNHPVDKKTGKQLIKIALVDDHILVR